MRIGDFLRDSAVRAPDAVALIGRGRRMTYAEFDRAASRLANALNALDLGKGARVAILSTNSPDYAVAYFAIARTPYVSVHCSTRSTAEELKYVLENVTADVIIFGSAFAPLIDAAIDSLKIRPRRIALDDEYRVPGVTMLDALVDGVDDTLPEWQPDDRDALAITLTGGTTGLPKAVLVSHGARCASALAAAGEFGLTADDIVVVTTPLFHTAGLFVWFGTAILQGATVVLAEAWDPEGFMAEVEREKISAAFLVPSQLNALISSPGFSAAKLATLNNIGYAGAPMSRALFDRVRSMLPGVSFTENYGQSEACPITIRTEDHGPDKLGTVGKVAKHTELAIVDGSGRILPVGTIGDIAVRGKTLFDEYFRNPEETARAFSLPGGWLQTGDVGFLDDDGFLTLVDRSKDMLVSGAENIYPAEIENTLYLHEAVVECAVFGIPDERWGEVPAAHVVLAADATLTEDELIEFCAARIARFKRPRVVRFVSSLPRTPVGKIRKNELRAPYWAGRERRI